MAADHIRARTTRILSAPQGTRPVRVRVQKRPWARRAGRPIESCALTDPDGATSIWISTIGTQVYRLSLSFLLLCRLYSSLLCLDTHSHTLSSLCLSTAVSVRLKSALPAADSPRLRRLSKYNSKSI